MSALAKRPSRRSSEAADGLLVTGLAWRIRAPARIPWDDRLETKDIHVRISSSRNLAYNSGFPKAPLASYTATLLFKGFPDLLENKFEECMKTLAFFTTLILFSLVSFAIGQESTPKEPRIKQLGVAYGFVLGQQRRLELVEKHYPDLSNDVKVSRFAFVSSALGESMDSMEAELSNLLGDKWPETKEKMNSEIQKLDEEEPLTKEQAISFLAEIEQRAKGELADDIRSTLLSANPRYAANPEAEMLEGWKQEFRTKEHPKAKGLDISISFPTCWTKREGHRPNIIQVFRSGAGHGPIMCTLMVLEDLPIPVGQKPSPEELNELFRPKMLEEMVPEGAKLIDAKSIVLDGVPAGMLVFDQTGKRVDLEFTMRMIRMVTILESSMIYIDFAIMDIPNSGDSLDDLQEKFLPVYRAIANTLKFNDNYK